MKTRTLLLLSVGTALAILLAGGVLLFQLSNEQNAVDTVQIGTQVQVGDVSITVLGVDGSDDVDARAGSASWASTSRSAASTTSTGSTRSGWSPATGVCRPSVRRPTADARTITADVTTCRLDFDVSGVGDLEPGAGDAARRRTGELEIAGGLTPRGRLSPQVRRVRRLPVGNQATDDEGRIGRYRDRR